MRAILTILTLTAVSVANAEPVVMPELPGEQSAVPAGTTSDAASPLQTFNAADSTASTSQPAAVFLTQYQDCPGGVCLMPRQPVRSVLRPNRNIPPVVLMEPQGSEGTAKMARGRGILFPRVRAWQPVRRVFQVKPVRRLVGAIGGRVFGCR